MIDFSVGLIASMAEVLLNVGKYFSDIFTYITRIVDILISFKSYLPTIYQTIFDAFLAFLIAYIIIKIFIAFKNLVPGI